MSAEEAYQEAVRRIDEAARNRALRLSLADLDDLEMLPPKIGILTELRILDLDGIKVSNLVPIQPLANLDFLFLSGTQITDLTPLQSLTGLHTLYLSNTQVDDLTPLQGLTGLIVLHLSGTQITDLTPLQRLTELQELSLSGTPIDDLRPLLTLSKLWSVLAENKGLLRFERTGATRNDPVLAELAQLEDQAELGRRLREYLESLPPWPEPLTTTLAPTEPKQKSSLNFIWTANGFALNSTSVGFDDDPVALATRDELVELINELCRQSGNHHDDIFWRGETLRKRLEEPELDLLRIHLAFQRLQRVYDQRGNREDPLQPEIEATLQDIVETLPGLTLGDERVRDLLERQARNRAERDDSKQSDVVSAIQGTAFGKETALPLENSPDEIEIEKPVRRSTSYLDEANTAIWFIFVVSLLASLVALVL